MAGAEGFEPPLAVLETAGLPLNLRPWVSTKTPSPPETGGRHFILLDFTMHLMLAALRAELLQLQPLGGGLFVLC